MSFGWIPSEKLGTGPREDELRATAWAEEFPSNSGEPHSGVLDKGAGGASHGRRNRRFAAAAR